MRSAFTTLKTAEQAPIPSPTMRIANVVKPASLRSVRNVYRRSWRSVSIKDRLRTSRCASRSCVSPPNSKRAARSASGAAIPERIFSSTNMDLWDSNSASRSRSRWELRNKALIREAICFSHVNMRLSLRPQLQQSSDHAGHAFPVLGFGNQLLTAALRNGVELGLAVVLRCAPFGLNPTLLNKTDQAEIDRPLIHEQRFVAQLLNAAGYAIAVERSHRVQGFQ